MIFLLVALSLLSSQVFCVNITVDNTDASIVYSGSFATVVTGAAGFDANGDIAISADTFLFSEDTSATATLSFNGSAVYYVASRWLSEDVSATFLSLDSATPELLDLTSLAGGVQDHAVLWSKIGLTNGPHTLVSSGGPGALAAVNAFIVTVPDPAVTASITLIDRPPAPTASNIVDVDITDRVAFDSTWSTAPDVCGARNTRYCDQTNGTFSFDFRGSELFVGAVSMPNGGLLTLSINGGAPQNFSLQSNETRCGFTSPQVAIQNFVRRNLQLAGRAESDVQNHATGLVVQPPVQLDTVSYRTANSAGDFQVNAASYFLMFCLLLLVI